VSFGIIRPWSPDIGAQPLATSVRLGETVILSATPVGTVPTGLAAWPDATWASSDTAVATVAPLAGQPGQAMVTPVALGTVAVTATISGKVQVYTVDVVASQPQAVIVVQGMPPGPIPWPSA